MIEVRELVLKAIVNNTSQPSPTQDKDTDSFDREREFELFLEQRKER